MAEKNAEAYDIMFRKAARAAFKEGAMWFASELAKGMAAIGEEEKKKEYPKTYEECEKILGLEDSIIEGCLGYEYKILNVFQKLLMCRDAYWKIAGEEMGLRKTWKPNWKDGNTKYSIFTIKGVLTKTTTCYAGAIFAFPTAEMRDAFKENFDKDLEFCKELL